MMAYEGSESVRDNLGKLIYQLKPKTKILVRKIERILIKSYRQNVSLSFDKACLNEGLLPMNWSQMIPNLLFSFFIRISYATHI